MPQEKKHITTDSMPDCKGGPRHLEDEDVLGFVSHLVIVPAPLCSVAYV